jgi:DNA repair protein RadC
MENLILREMKLQYTGRKKKLKNDKVDKPEAVHLLFSWTRKELQELFIVLLLDNKNSVIGWQTISKGTVSEAIVHPRDVFRLAVRENDLSRYCSKNILRITLNQTRKGIVVKSLQFSLKKTA